MVCAEPLVLPGPSLPLLFAARRAKRKSCRLRSSQTQEVLWPVRKHITILQQLRGEPMHASSAYCETKRELRGRGGSRCQVSRPTTLMGRKAS